MMAFTVLPLELCSVHRKNCVSFPSGQGSLLLHGTDDTVTVESAWKEQEREAAATGSPGSRRSLQTPCRCELVIRVKVNRLCVDRPQTDTHTFCIWNRRLLCVCTVVLFVVNCSTLSDTNETSNTAETFSEGDTKLTQKLFLMGNQTDGRENYRIIV